MMTIQTKRTMKMKKKMTKKMNNRKNNNKGKLHSSMLSLLLFNQQRSRLRLQKRKLLLRMKKLNKNNELMGDEIYRKLSQIYYLNSIIVL